MRKIIFAIVGCAVFGAAGAADVVERVDCADTKERIDNLAALENPDDGDRALLADLRALYRKNCTVRAAGRGARTIAKTRNVGTDAPAKSDDDAPVIAESCAAPDANGCCPGEDFEDMGADGKFCCKGDMCFPPMAVAASDASVSVASQQSPEEIAANIEKGLCENGEKPNKFGCCGAERFKDMGNAAFACCQKDGSDCFLPIDGTTVTKRTAFNTDDK